MGMDKVFVWCGGCWFDLEVNSYCRFGSNILYFKGIPIWKIFSNKQKDFKLDFIETW